MGSGASALPVDKPVGDAKDIAAMLENLDEEQMYLVYKAVNEVAAADNNANSNNAALSKEGLVEVIHGLGAEQVAKVKSLLWGKFGLKAPKFKPGDPWVGMPDTRKVLLPHEEGQWLCKLEVNDWEKPWPEKMVDWLMGKYLDSIRKHQDNENEEETCPQDKERANAAWIPGTTKYPRDVRDYFCRAFGNEDKTHLRAAFYEPQDPAWTYTALPENDDIEIETDNVDLSEEQIDKLKVEIEEIQARLAAENDNKAKWKINVPGGEAAFPLLQQAEESLDVLDKRDFQELKALCKPPGGVDEVFRAGMCLLAGVSECVQVDQEGNILDGSWKGSCKMMSNPAGFMENLKSLKDKINAGTLPAKNIEDARTIKDQMGRDFCFEIMRKKSSAVAGLCVFVINIIMYFDVVSQLEPEVRQSISDALTNPELAELTARIKDLGDSLCQRQATLRQSQATLEELEDEKKRKKKAEKMKLQKANAPLWNSSTESCLDKDHDGSENVTDLTCSKAIQASLFAPDLFKEGEGYSKYSEETRKKQAKLRIMRRWHWTAAGHDEASAACGPFFESREDAWIEYSKDDRFYLLHPLTATIETGPAA